MIGRKTSLSAQGKKIGVPKVLRHSLTKYGKLSRIDRIKKPDPKMAEGGKFLVQKSLCHSLICREGVLCSNEPLS